MKSVEVLTYFSNAEVISVPLGTPAHKRTCGRVTLWCLCGTMSTSLATVHTPRLVDTICNIELLFDTVQTSN